MNDPKRIFFAYESEIERALLNAGRRGAPTGARQRALLAASAALAGTSLVAGGSVVGKAATVTKVGSVALFKWIGLLCVIGVSAAVSAVVVRDLRESEPRTSMAATKESSRIAASQAKPVDPISPPAVPPVPASAAAEPPSAPAAFPTTMPAHGTVRSVPKFVESGATNASSLPIELAMLDESRAAIRTGAWTRALSMLDAYSVRFPRGAMAPEAAVLRVEVLVKKGDRSAAARFANAILARDPRSPYALRIQSLLGASNP
ncbi:MAG: tetratricopeptide repeat protein [Myxococcota bacterium]|nr:tetratricopeptide repeat protein [Myxococcota bacterium]